MRNKFVLAFGLILVAGCAPAPPAPTHSPEQRIPTSGIVTFNGNECSYSGLTQLIVGEHPILFVDNTDLSAQLGVRRIMDGYTYQDLVDKQPAPGVEFPRPEWVEGVRIVGKSEWDESMDGWVFTYDFNATGESFFRIHHRTYKDGEKNEGFYLCGSITVVDVTSE